eukprot:scaffold24732_cov162-Cylindrotheca_fusiformis.AAC.2
MLSSIASNALRLSAVVGSGAVRPASFRAAFFSSGSHDDFAPKRKVVEGADEALKMIQEHVDTNPIMLYMKGNPTVPMCGFSSQVVNVLKLEGVDFSSVNVLDYPDIREGVKKFSDWPTIPQLYVNGEFIGGCDIVLQMHESGELAELFKELREEEE